MTDASDLDRLIGDLRAEAARRRAEPGYPVDEEARIHHELRRRAPRPQAEPTLAELVARVEEELSALVEAGPGAGAPGRGRRRRRPAGGGVPLSLGLAVGGALRHLAGHVEELERRVAGAEQARRALLAGVLPASGDDRGRALLGSWLERVVAALGPAEGRVLYADADAPDVVARLRREGIDAYGVVSVTGPDDGEPDVRHMDLLEHLGGLSEASLAAVALVGPPDRSGGSTLAALVRALVRCADMLVLASHAPWSWRAEVGPAADLADGRPAALDTWMEMFQAAGFSADGETGEDGRSYLVVARRRR